MVILLVSGLWLFVRGPFYDFMKVKKYPAFVNIILLDHIGAHIKAETPIEDEDLTYLNRLIPVEKWPYKCFNSEIRNMDGPIPFDTFAVPDIRPAKIALKLFLKNPQVDLLHTICAGRLVWQVYPGYPIYSIPLSGRNYGIKEEAGLKADTMLPGLSYTLPVPPLKIRSCGDQPSTYW